MLGLDELLLGLGSGDALLVASAVALLLGLRHATDPDHLAAVSVLIASDPDDGARRARRLGLLWGAGHATTLVLLGLPVVLFKSHLPAAVESAAEAAVGLVIAGLAMRLLVRWRRGRFHVHAHRHGDVEHRHLHPHAEGPAHAHEHAPERRLGRSPREAFAIGLMHGVGGSAGIGVLLLAGLPDTGAAAAALLVFATGAALSMAALSSLFGYVLTRGPVVRRALALAPALGSVTLAFGLWYTLAAFSVVPPVV